MNGKVRSFSCTRGGLHGNFSAGKCVSREDAEAGEGAAMESWLKVGLLVLIAVLLGDVAMAKGGEAAKSAKSAKSEIRTGNLSKAHRDELTAKIGEIKAFLEQNKDFTLIEDNQYMPNELQDGFYIAVLRKRDNNG